MIRFAILFPLISLVLLASTAHAQQSVSPIDQLTGWLETRELSDEHLTAAASELWSHSPLTREQAELARQALWKARRSFLQKERLAEVEAREIERSEHRMRFWYAKFGAEPESGRSLFISLHGGGGAPAAVNDQQYENQKQLYRPAEGIYLVPRAATDTWDLWHQNHIDEFLDQLIADMVVLENVDPDRVYLMGYSAGGDGVYQLAPRMADRLAAASMMAGHPNESRPDGLRNIGFTIHMGGEDSAYSRNTRAAEWSQKLAALQAEDPEGYTHEVTLHAGLGHWMNLQDAVAVPWMAKFHRNPWPKKVVWVQDDVLHPRFYWLRTDTASAKAGDEIVASVSGNTIAIKKCSTNKLTVLLNDHLVDLDKPVTIVLPDGNTSAVQLVRTIGSLAQSLLERTDPKAFYDATTVVLLKQDAFLNTK